MIFGVGVYQDTIQSYICQEQIQDVGNGTGEGGGVWITVKY